MRRSSTPPAGHSRSITTLRRRTGRCRCRRIPAALRRCQASPRQVRAARLSPGSRQPQHGGASHGAAMQAPAGLTAGDKRGSRPFSGRLGRASLLANAETTRRAGASLEWTCTAPHALWPSCCADQVSPGIASGMEGSQQHRDQQVETRGRTAPRHWPDVNCRARQRQRQSAATISRIASQLPWVSSRCQQRLQFSFSAGPEASPGFEWSRMHASEATSRKARGLQHAVVPPVM